MSTPPKDVAQSPPLKAADLPFITAEIAPIAARIKEAPSDFVVHELPAYAPTGSGDHLWVHFEKEGLGTPDAVKRIARALGVEPRDAGYAGLKDRHAITTQWASFLFGKAEKLENVELENIRLLTVTRHTAKLRTGHLRGNRFELVLRGASQARSKDVERVFALLAERGVPNYFGEQRFGFDGRNIDEAKRWIVENGHAPRDQWKRKLLVSVLQSVVFNDVVATRIRDGLFDDAVAGDLLRKEDTGGLFTTDDLEDARARVRAWAVSPTGPMFGTGMRPAEHEANKRELESLARTGLTPEHLVRFGRAGEGTRRVMRIRPTDVTIEWSAEETLKLGFSLMRGAYATVVVRELTKGVTPNLDTGGED
ncbi:MAG: tRNA pseudouridine(13) synthase TruD [Sandaracinaceae bacterium]|nr:tRNA pseudouridine(13) synthase TruD [Sandaracinaceae bacterium]